ncbi:hypothetical protein CEUSTIGMA_g10650.t1 [Chlamydomonas eustigma]|uniref:FAS1 domain-containing protein n=1 Tax=Chlamydomonas eustigma TaxID=1157962 RepID=A0A250XJH3_9CHLO|nr:hypothetical protein CEUSTIGMA_g10650.t1 [Chlamydomonas eustigma]|eukprot:GAX83224.1 hypothetical protein CEUSTIGMA_g10650.t1 [Chlamydomonas eustigma]
MPGAPIRREIFTCSRFSMTKSITVLSALATLALISHASEGRVLNSEVTYVGSSETNDAPLSIWQLITSDSNYTVLEELVKAAKLVNFLNDTSSSLTMIMPVNSAWSGFMEEINSNLDQLLVSNETLQQLLLYHVHEGFLPSQDLTPGTIIPMYNLQNISVFTLWDGSTCLRDVAGRTIEFLDWGVEAEDSIGYAVGRVMFPVRPSTIGEALLYDTEFSLMRAALVASGNVLLLNSTIANVTLFVPTNSAFNQSLTAVNLTFEGLLKNTSLLNNMVAAHILTRAVNWYSLDILTYHYFSTLNSCAKFFTQQDSVTGETVLVGQGSIQGMSARIIEADLYGGSVALIHVINSVLLPLHKWGTCSSPTWRPTSPPT